MPFHFMSSEWACDKLRITRRQSYALLPVTPSGLVRSDRVLGIINWSGTKVSGTPSKTRLN